MEQMKEGVLSKVKSVISVIYDIFLRMTKLSSSPKPFPLLHHLQLGLGALNFSSAQKLFSSSLSWLSSSSSSSSSSSTSSSSCFSWSSTVGDLIGTESGVYISSNEEKLLGEVDKTKPYTNNMNQRKRNKMIGTEREKNYPPPIPSLARTGYLTGRMPWVLTRRYVNGRLILKEERLNRYEYFEVHRENDRIRLNLIPLDNTRCCHPVEKNEDIDEQVEVENDGERNDRDDEQKKQDEVEDPVKEKGSRILLACSRNEGDIRRCYRASPMRVPQYQTQVSLASQLYR